MTEGLDVYKINRLCYVTIHDSNTTKRFVCLGSTLLSTFQAILRWFYLSQGFNNYFLKVLHATLEYAT